ncbi:hypothetical protein EMIT0P2_10213 [Pseudomonas sp. IT-P2]
MGTRCRLNWRITLNANGSARRYKSGLSWNDLEFSGTKNGDRFTFQKINPSPFLSVPFSVPFSRHAQFGKDFSLSPRTDAEITARAEGMADMFSAYMIALNAR